MRISKIVYIFGFLLNLLHQGKSCTPVISISIGTEQKPGGQSLFDCDILSCSSLSGLQIRWDKKDVLPTEDWTPVYSSSSGALDTGTPYNIKDRNQYIPIDGVKHTLIVQELKLQDHGMWNCIILDDGGAEYTGNSLLFNIFVNPQPDAIVITPADPKLVDLNSQEFTCYVSGIHPEPNIIWKVNQTSQSPVEPENTIDEDGYWSSTSRYTITFDVPGTTEIGCVLEVRDNGDSWEENTIPVDVKERARIVDQDGDQETLVNMTFSLDCGASGHIPLISWEREGSPINDGEDYTITSGGTSNQRTSMLASASLDPPYTCDNVMTYGGSYRCVATLTDPYQHSTDISDNMVITILYAPIFGRDQIQEHGIGEADVVLTCEICASKILSDKWMLNGSDYTGGVLPDGSVSIEKIEESSFGNYTRVVTNSFGTGKCSIMLYHKSELDIVGLSAGQIAGIVIGCLFVVAAIPLILFLVKRYKRHKQKADEEVTAYAESGNTGAADNNGNRAKGGTTDGNTSATQPVYAEVNKNKKKHTTEETTGPVYSEVNKSGRPLPKPKISRGSTNTGPVYSEVNKPKQGRLTPIENHSRGSGGGEAVGRPLPPIIHTRQYDNAGQRNEQGGLHYADVDFLRKGHGTKQTYGTKNLAYEPTEYAQIDHRKSAGIVV